MGKDRPTSVTVGAIYLIVLGALGTLGALNSLLLMSRLGSSHGVAGPMGVMVFEGVVKGTLLALGIGMLQRQNWARIIYIMFVPAAAACAALIWGYEYLILAFGGLPLSFHGLVEYIGYLDIPIRIGIYAAIVYFLMQDDAALYFAYEGDEPEKPEPPATPGPQPPRPPEPLA